jgi:gamma-glutamylcyclotransferase (GGCT)/AIG2-like uncharacterized protein YtfP
MHIFTYGTLMFPEVWAAVAGRAYESVAAELGAYAVYRVDGAVFPGIVAANSDDVVPGIVYLDVDTAAVARLDRFEDDFYIRRTLTIACDDGRERRADAYVVPAEQRAVLTDERWTREAFIASGGLEEFLRRFAGFARVRKEQ